MHVLRASDRSALALLEDVAAALARFVTLAGLVSQSEHM